MYFIQIEPDTLVFLQGSRYFKKSLIITWRLISDLYYQSILKTNLEYVLWIVLRIFWSLENGIYNDFKAKLNVCFKVKHQIWINQMVAIFLFSVRNDRVTMSKLYVFIEMKNEKWWWLKKFFVSLFKVNPAVVPGSL